MLEQLLGVFKRRRPLDLWRHEFYRLPLASAESTVGLETRRADDAYFYLVRFKTVLPARIHTPAPVSFEALLRVHTPAYVESLTQRQTLASIFALNVEEVEAETLLASIRVACGGTVEAAQRTLATKDPTLNLLGGFHHAGPARGGGFCAVNDIAVAVAAVRAEGFEGKIGVIDLDAHPSDGTAECFKGDSSVWLGSISGVSWGPLAGVDEVVLPAGTGDVVYLEALEGLLARMPTVDLAFVIAGGDVIAGDRLGQLGLTLAGARQRDLKVAEHLHGLPQVWLPAGGYGSHAWKVLAGSALALVWRSAEAIPSRYDPLAARFKDVSRRLSSDALGNEPLITEADLAEMFGHKPAGAKKLLGFYTAEGLEYALEAYGLMPLVRRMGYGELHVAIETVAATDRVRVTGKDSRSGERVNLVELEVERRGIDGGSFLFINWLSLRNPRAKFSPQRPQLPGQEVPGLGLAREMSQILALMAKRLVLDGIAFRPSWYHMAFAGRHTGRFVTPARQGRFEALVRDLKHLPLLEVTHALSDGRVQLNGEPYKWEPEEMIQWLVPHRNPDAAAEISTERDRCHFTLDVQGQAVSGPAASLAPQGPDSAG